MYNIVYKYNWVYQLKLAVITKDIGDIMAEKNNNVDELNRLAQDGRIAEKEDDKEHKKDVQEAAKGKKVIEDVEQIIDVSTLEFYVSENNLFKNMNEPCKFEGINI